MRAVLESVAMAKHCRYRDADNLELMARDRSARRCSADPSNDFQPGGPDRPQNIGNVDNVGNVGNFGNFRNSEACPSLL